MKSVRFLEVGQYRKVLAIDDKQADPEATKRAIMDALGISEDELFAREDFEQLVEQHVVFSSPVAGEALFEDDDSGVIALQAAFKSLGETQNQFLDFSGAVIPDWRGTKYHLKAGGIWTEVEIADVGIAVPEGAVFPDALTEEQRKEIAEQREAARIAALSPEARAAELSARLEDLADKADQLERRAHIQGKEFDPKSWYQEHKGLIEEKYAS